MLVIASILLIALANTKMVMVQEVFRHGARYPIYPSPNDKTMYAVTEDRVGELTSQGKRMHFLLGQRISKDYWTALGLGDTINNSQIYVKSTNINRTIQSAQSHLMGLLESLPALTLTQQQVDFSLPAWENVTIPKEPQVFINIPRFHTLPIHTELAGSTQLNPGDFLFYFASVNCPKTAKWQEENFKGELAKSVLSNPKIIQAIQKLQKTYNVSNLSLDDVGNYVDNFYCSYHLGKEYDTSLFVGQYRDTLDTIRSIAYNLGGFGQELQVKSTITPFFKATLDSMESIKNNKTDRRLIIYSAHDMTLANVLNGLNLTSASCIWDQFLNPTKETDCIWRYPDFASSIIFELSQSDTDPLQYFVQVRYSGMYVKLPFCNNSLTCSYNDFKAYLTSRINENYLDDCDVTAVIKPQPLPEFSAPIGLIIPLCLVSALLFLIIVYEAYRFFKKKKEEANAGPYQHNIEEAS